MRPQASKPLPKKGAVSKSTSKTSPISKQTKKKAASPKKVKSIAQKSLTKGPKKAVYKDDVPTNKYDGEKNDPSIDTSKAGPSKTSTSRSSSPAKRKKDSKKAAAKNIEVPVKKTPKKGVKTGKKASKPNIKNTETKTDDVKYKINSEVAKKTPKFSKAKTVVKKGIMGNPKKKSVAGEKEGQQEKQQLKEEIFAEKESSNKNDDNQVKSDNKEEKLENKVDSKLEVKSEEKAEEKEVPMSPTENSNPAGTSSANTSDTPKVETERPPKFFTSTRAPRTVDIDVKCCKTSKGNLTVSERFLSMKFETKNEDNNKDKNAPNALVSQGAEIDVYTFTEKVDSPKSILTEFRPIAKNVGRVRPIARVKGTIIDKKTDSEKKKYSPHRPIEEVVKQLKANKRTEELNASATQIPLSTSVVESVTQNEEKDPEEKPKPIVSKSYKMVARKSSVTGKPFSPIKFLDSDPTTTKVEKSPKNTSPVSSKKAPSKPKKQQKKPSISDEDIDTSKFALNTTFNYTSSDESVSESNDDNDTKESSGSDTPKTKKMKNKKYKRITDSAKKSTPSKELKELSKDSLVDLKDNSLLMGEKPSKRRLKLLSMWAGPKKHRMASLNAMAKVHCLYENESRTHMELGLMKTIDRQVLPSTSTSKATVTKKKDSKGKDADRPVTSTSESDYETKTEKKDESSESSDDNPPPRTLRGVPGIRSAGKYWDPKSSTSSSEDSEMETKKKNVTSEKKKTTPKAAPAKSDTEKPPAKMKKTAGVPVKKKRNRNEVVMDLKDMVVQKRMASLNATAILAASYEKRSPKSNKDDTTSDSCSDESFSQKPKNGVSSGVKSEAKSEEPKKEFDDSSITDRKQKVEVIVNQDTDVTITGVYSTHHEGFCTAMQYRISSTSHTQTTATANCEKEGCSRDDGARYTPLSALSSMQPPAEHVHTHPHPVPELGGLARRAAGCSSAFSAPSPAHHEPGYYQPAGPLIKESGADAERALARYHPPPHYHAPHPSVLQQYGPPYYPTELCYGRYYRPSGAYHVPPPQPDAQMVGVGSEPYPPPQYYGTPPCYQHSPQRIPYLEYRCPCPLNACPKNVLIGPATGKAPTGGGPDVPSALAPPGGAFRAKVRACALDAAADTHGSGKDPPLESEPPAAADAPHPCPLPAIGGASPKRELYDVRDNLRLAGDMPGPAEPVGPPSPARGSAGACAPQPPPAAPRRARLGKAMARRSLAGDDTGLLLSAPQAPAQHSDADDDVLAISPPVCAPIDLSSSDERSTPLVDVKKENEGPTNALSRKTDAQALREHNCTTVSEQPDVTEASKAVKRRYSRPKLEIDMKDTQLEDVCKTNGIGEHVKLQKRRKVSGEQTDVRLETVTREPKKKASPTKRAAKTPVAEKRTLKRKIENASMGPRSKKVLIESPPSEDPRLKNVAAVAEEPSTPKPKTKSALLLDNLLRKNSIDRPESKTFSEAKLNPAELFFSPDENVAQTCSKKTLNINNNVVESATPPVNGVRPNTIAAVSQLIGKKMAYKNPCKVEKVDSKITHSLKSVLKTPPAKSSDEADDQISERSAPAEVAAAAPPSERIDCTEATIETEAPKEDRTADVGEKPAKAKAKPTETGPDGPDDESQPPRPETDADRAAEARAEKAKRTKLTNGELKGKSVEKVVKLLVSKRPAVKTDEATLVVEDACSSGGGVVGRRARRRRSGAGRRRRAAPPAPAPPDPHPPAREPRWSNGWSFDGDHYVTKVYLNNDSRLDRPARCWARMTHASGDSVARGDCVLLRASLARAQPFVARVASLWQNPDDGEMMVSLVWYYRPEHTERGRTPADAPDEVFASRHRDANSVACIEDKCYVLTFNEYCRYRKRLKAMEEGIVIPPSIVPAPAASDLAAAWAPNDARLPPSVSPDLVLFCRKVYDFRSKKIHVPNK